LEIKAQKKKKYGGHGGKKGGDERRIIPRKKAPFTGVLRSCKREAGTLDGGRENVNTVKIGKGDRDRRLHMNGAIQSIGCVSHSAFT